MVALNYSATAVVSGRPAREALSRLEAQRDVILVSRFKAGDEAAFVEIVTHYRGKMLHAAQSMLRNRADAEEISQDTFIRAYRNLATFRGESSLAAWLYCITLNLSRNRYWYFFRRRRHTSLSLDAALGEASTVTLADVMTSDEPSPVRETVNNEFSALVALCADQLPTHQREILLLRSHQHHTYVHISRLLGIGVGTVKSRIARARANLRILVAKTHPEFSRDASLFDCFESFRACHHQAAICS